MGKENLTAQISQIETWAGKVNFATTTPKIINGITYLVAPDPALQKYLQDHIGDPDLTPETRRRYEKATITFDPQHPLIRIIVPAGISGWWKSDLPKEYRETKESSGFRVFLERLAARAKKENRPDLAKQYEDELKKPGISPNSPLAWRNRRQRERLLPLEFRLAQAAANRGKTRPDSIATKTEASSQPKKRKRADSPYSFDESLKRIHQRLKEERKTQTPTSLTSR